jgi:AcrR family transcriptional regulator
MPRVRSDDYDAKAQNILDSAAALFAKVGYPNAKMQDIAKACGATKSMLYHYFPTKDDLLAAMLEEHLQQVIDAIEEVAVGKAPAKERFSAFVEVYAQKSNQTRRRNVTAMNDIKFLPRAMQTPLLEMERKVTDQVAQLLRELNGALPEEVYKPYTMLLLGMLNWTDYWYKPSGPVKAQELSERISRLFLRGFLAEKG